MHCTSRRGMRWSWAASSREGSRSRRSTSLEQASAWGGDVRGVHRLLNSMSGRRGHLMGVARSRTFACGACRAADAAEESRCARHRLDGARGAIAPRRALQALFGRGEAGRVRVGAVRARLRHDRPRRAKRARGARKRDVGRRLRALATGRALARALAARLPLHVGGAEDAYSITRCDRGPRTRCRIAAATDTWSARQRQIVLDWCGGQLVHPLAYMGRKYVYSTRRGGRQLAHPPLAQVGRIGAPVARLDKSCGGATRGAAARRHARRVARGGGAVVREGARVRLEEALVARLYSKEEGVGGAASRCQADVSLRAYGIHFSMASLASHGRTRAGRSPRAF